MYIFPNEQMNEWMDISGELRFEEILWRKKIALSCFDSKIFFWKFYFGEKKEEQVEQFGQIIMTLEGILGERDFLFHPLQWSEANFLGWKKSSWDKFKRMRRPKDGSDFDKKRV